MMCIRNVVIRKILVLRVCRWPYLAVCDFAWVSMQMMVRVIRVVKRIGGSWLWECFVVVMNRKDRNHILGVDWRVSIPLYVMRIILRLQSFVAFLMMWILLSMNACLIVEQRQRVTGFGRLAWRPCVVRRWRVHWRHFIGLLIARAPHKHRLSMQHLIVGSVCRRWVFQLRLDCKNFGRCWVGSIRCDNAFVGWGGSIDYVIGRAFRSFVFRVRMMYYLIKNIT